VIGSFKANNPRNNFLLLLYGLALNWPLFFNKIPAAINSNDSFLYQYFFGILIKYTNNTIIASIAFFILFLQAVSINKIVTDQKMFQRNNYLTGMSYLLITSIFHVGLTSTLIAVSFLIWILSIMFNTSTQGNPKKNVFNIGLLTGVTVLIFSPAFLFVFVVFFGLLIFRPFKIQEWIVLVLGIIAPFYFVFAFGFLLDKNEFLTIPSMFLRLPKFNLSGFEIGSLCTTLLLVIIGFAFTQSNMRKLLVQSRNCWSIITVVLIFALLVPFFNKASQFYFTLFCFVPASIFVASTFYYPEKKWFINLSHWILVALSVLNGYFFIIH
jgi:hypothetical protein